MFKYMISKITIKNEDNVNFLINIMKKEISDQNTLIEKEIIIKNSLGFKILKWHRKIHLL